MCDHYKKQSGSCARHRDQDSAAGERTRDPTLVNSLSAVTRTDCTRNLSRHFASGGGSSFIAWRRTTCTCQSAAETPRGVRMEGLRTLNFNIFARFDATTVRSHTVSMLSNVNRGEQGEKGALEVILFGGGGFDLGTLAIRCGPHRKRAERVIVICIP